ncbi:putative GMC oxidoreductase [Gregarina niphandrodes]|uniref:GMC oxidoreductase n=1 Tax=Gregarina niphandrodes TaxID=110365 RepID=A0A023B4C1_GRENI|nr:putative GMC oxidoreductase [Gregarina niphandrodes]EZG56679.1 putative GMC oxidoreductase [Gregarina niphandrodes]|eukprot:XP_011131209.1 putative GMC oxidoreductase [Gregarina niphandrodes]
MIGRLVKLELLYGLSVGDSGLFQRLMLSNSGLPSIFENRRLSFPEFLLSRLPPTMLRKAAPGETFDYIVVGGGGSGCPLARTLADAGYKTLLIERGGLREEHPVTWTLDGSGATLMDAQVSQPVVTTEGYISHIGRVLGGGTSVNLGFYIEGNDMESTVEFQDSGLWQQSVLWLRDRLAFPADHSSVYDKHLQLFMEGITANNSVGNSPEYVRGRTWNGMSLFETNTRFRASADTLLGPIDQYPPSLVLSVNTTATKITFVRNLEDRFLRADCVEVEDTAGTVALLSKPESVVGILQSENTLRSWIRWYPNIVRFIGSLFQRRKPAPNKYQVCLNDHPDSKIISSAGAILTPALLYQSGIGPLEETRRLGVHNILPLRHLGRNLGDRVFLPIAFFFKRHIPNLFDPAILRSAALWDATTTFNNRGSVFANTTQRPIQESVVPESMIQDQATHQGSSDAEVSLEQVPYAEGMGRHKPRYRTQMSALNDLLQISDPSPSEDQAILQDQVAPEGQEGPEDASIPESMPESGRESVDDGLRDKHAFSSKELEQMLHSHMSVEHSRWLASKTAGENDVEQGDVDQRGEEHGGEDQDEDIGLDGVRDEEGRLVFQGVGGMGGFRSGRSLVGLEEISGGLMTTGCGVATRYFFPPLLRTSAAVDVALDTLFGCATHRPGPEGGRGVFSLCALVDPILSCFRHSAALVYLLPQPKSLGQVSIGGPDGSSVTVQGNYFKDDRDVVSATIGLANILQALDNSTIFDEVFEFSSSYPAPASSYRGPAVTLNPGAPSTAALLSGRSTCPVLIRDKLSTLFQRITGMLTPYLSLQEARVAVEELPEDLNSFSRYASFPAVLPNPYDADDVAAFVQRASTSMWHWYGSARIGRVVDSNFAVAGTRRLSIVDAGVISRLPKMNPQVGVMTLGRYAALTILRKRTKPATWTT